jgi:hypothetical protein
VILQSETSYILAVCRFLPATGGPNAAGHPEIRSQVRPAFMPARFSRALLRIPGWFEAPAGPSAVGPHGCCGLQYKKGNGYFFVFRAVDRMLLPPGVWQARMPQ